LVCRIFKEPIHPACTRIDLFGETFILLCEGCSALTAVTERIASGPIKEFLGGGSFNDAGFFLEQNHDVFWVDSVPLCGIKDELGGIFEEIVDGVNIKICIEFSVRIEKCGYFV